MLFMALSIQSCKVYQKPMTVSEALENVSKGYIKVNLKNGDELIFEKIQKSEGQLIGINHIELQEIKTVLNENDIQNIEKQSKKSSTAFTILGVIVGVGSVLIGIGMF